MMKKERRKPRHFDDQFRLSVLKDYYESGSSYGQISRKYAYLCHQIFKNWKDRCLWQRN